MVTACLPCPAGRTVAPGMGEEGVKAMVGGRGRFALFLLLSLGICAAVSPVHVVLGYLLFFGNVETLQVLVSGLRRDLGDLNYVSFYFLYVVAFLLSVGFIFAVWALKLKLTTLGRWVLWGCAIGAALSLKFILIGILGGGDWEAVARVAGLQVFEGGSLAATFWFLMFKAFRRSWTEELVRRQTEAF